MSKYCPVTDSMVPYPVCKDCDRTDCEEFSSIMKRLKEHQEKIKEYIPFSSAEIFFTSLYGSQNYGIQGPGSDVDSKTVLLPSKKLLYTNSGDISENIECGSGEYSDVKDLHSYLMTVWKGNLNFIETLFSDYVAVNPVYKADYYALISKRDRLARAYPYRILYCVNGMAYNTYKQRFDSDTGNIKGKKVSTIFRLANFSQSYIDGVDVKKCFKSFPVYGKDALLSAKFRNEFNEKDIDAALKIVENNLKAAESLPVLDMYEELNDLAYQILSKRDFK